MQRRTQVVKVFEGECDLSSVETRLIFGILAHAPERERPDATVISPVRSILPKMREHFPAAGEVQGQIEVRVVFEGIHEVHEEGKFDRLQDALLGERVLDLFQFHDRLLLHDLQSQRLTAVLGDHHATERARAHRALQLKFVEFGRLLRWLGVFRVEVVLGAFQVRTDLGIDLSLTGVRRGGIVRR